MTFDEWLKNARLVEGQRYGQALMNTAPTHIYHYASGDLLLDCFYSNERVPAYALQVERFVTFAKLCWDTTDEEEMKAARLLIWREM